MQDQGLLSDDDEILKEMADVEFPTAGKSEDDNDDKTGNSHALKTAVIVDIKTQGWDDDAIVRCLDLAILRHDNPENHFNPAHFEFSPVPNTKRAEHLQRYTTAQDDSDINHTDGHKLNLLQTQRNETNTKTWNPSELTKPKWAVNPLI